MALMQRRHYEFLADEVAPLMGWPTSIHRMADKLSKTNPNFDRDKFISRAVKNWEDANPVEELDDGLPY